MSRYLPAWISILMTLVSAVLWAVSIQTPDPEASMTLLHAALALIGCALTLSGGALVLMNLASDELPQGATVWQRMRHALHNFL